MLQRGKGMIKGVQQKSVNKEQYAVGEKGVTIHC